MHAKKTIESLAVPSLAHQLRIADVPLAEVRFRMTQALGQEGFTAQAEFDLADFVNRSVDGAHPAHFLYQACHPKLTSEALAIACDASLVLPMTIGLWQEGREVVVAHVPAARLVVALGRAHLAAIAAEVDARLERAFARMSAPAPAACDVPPQPTLSVPPFAQEELEALREATGRQIHALMAEVAGTESHALQHAIARTITKLETIAAKLGKPAVVANASA
jgi:uncharacterized protein (DUF302 family)